MRQQRDPATRDGCRHLSRACRERRRKHRAARTVNAGSPRHRRGQGTDCNAIDCSTIGHSTSATAPAPPAPSLPAPAGATSAAPLKPAAPPKPASSAYTIAFGGDVHFEGVDGIRLRADPATAIGPISSVLSEADLAMVNLETAVTTRGTPAAKKYTFRAPPTAFTALRSAGIDVVTMANNHGVDFGPVGLQDTLDAARAAHFPVVGIGANAAQAYAPYTVTVKGNRVAILGATQVLDAKLAYAWSAGPDKPGLASAYNVPRLVSAVRAARTHADTVIVYLHWGREQSTCPISAQRTLASAARGRRG